MTIPNVGDGTTAEEVPQKINEGFMWLTHKLVDDNIRNSVAFELWSSGFISPEIKNEATRISGDPRQKAITMVDEVVKQINLSPQSLLQLARILSQIPEVNLIGMMLESMHWRTTFTHLMSGMHCMGTVPYPNTQQAAERQANLMASNMKYLLCKDACITVYNIFELCQLPCIESLTTCRKKH